jgi:probable HAF family extracellular repeat protein
MRFCGRTVMTDLGTLGVTFSDASDIDERGQIVGTSTTAAGERHAFLWQEGVMTDLGMLGGCGPIVPSSEAHGINDHGQVVGQTTTPSCEAHAFLAERSDDRPRHARGPLQLC